MSSQVHPGRKAAALGHPLRVALLDLLSRRATLTSTQAARELGESSGACSFHLRQLERYGHVEEAPGPGGRARPWRLAPQPPKNAGAQNAGAQNAGAQNAVPGDEFGELIRELENEGYRRWLAGRQTAPPGWRDEAFSAVLYLEPAELAEVAAAVRAVIDSFGDRADPARRAQRAIPVGVVARMFPLLPASSDG